jgi:hypothetical protein
MVSQMFSQVPPWSQVMAAPQPAAAVTAPQKADRLPMKCF